MLNMVKCFLGHITGAQFSSNNIEKLCSEYNPGNELLYFHSFRFYRFEINFFFYVINKCAICSIQIYYSTSSSSSSDILRSWRHIKVNFMLQFHFSSLFQFVEVVKIIIANIIRFYVVFESLAREFKSFSTILVVGSDGFDSIDWQSVSVITNMVSF